MVFKTIAENVKSFFAKEESLEKEPKRTKDAAVELFEKPTGNAPDHHIVAHPLKPIPRTESAPSAVKKPLPYSSEQLRQRLAAQQANTATVSSRPPSRPSASDDEIVAQIVEFERAITTIPGEDGSSLPLSSASERRTSRAPSAAYSSSAPSSSVTSSSYSSAASSPASFSSRRNDGYFDELAAHLRNQGYAVDEAQLETVLSNMRQHHEFLYAKEQHQERGRGLEEALTQKLAELQELERDWASKHEEIHAARMRVVELEESIARRTGELKGLVSTMKSHSTQMPAPTSALPSPVPVAVRAAVPEAIAPPVTNVPPVPPAPAPSLSSSNSSPSSVFAPPLPVYSSSLPSSVSPPVSPSLSSPSPVSSVPSSSLPSGHAAPSPAAPLLSIPPTPPSFSRLDSSTFIVPANQRFLLKDGRSLASLEQLRAALRTMDDGVYFHHVTPQRNDFSAWIRDVFCDEALAQRVAQAKNRYDLLSTLSA